MSAILLQQDNITILGNINDISNVDVNIKKQLDLQIIITVNGKQKFFNTHYNLCYWSEFVNVDNKDYLQLTTDNSWYNLKNFLVSIWYDLQKFNLVEAINKICKK